MGTELALSVISIWFIGTLSRLAQRFRKFCTQVAQDDIPGFKYLRTKLIFSFILSHRSQPLNWSLPPSPPQPVPALPLSCSSFGTLRSWSDWGRNWEQGVSSTMDASFLRENSEWRPLGASSTLTVSSKRCWDSTHQCQGPTEPPCRHLNLM